MRGAWLGAFVSIGACALGADGPANPSSAGTAGSGSSDGSGTMEADGRASTEDTANTTDADETGSSDGGCEPTLWFDDGDGDGHGDPRIMVRACQAPAGHVPVGDDCDDGDPEVHPAFTERCDGKDNDCDGLLDEASDDNPSCHGCELMVYDGHAYALCAGDATWDGARTACQGDFEADLLVLDDAAENTAVMDFATSTSGLQYWIGAFDEDGDGTYQWVDGSPLDFTNWFRGQPDDFLGLEDCVQVRAETLWAWNDYPCSEPIGWICEAG